MDFYEFKRECGYKGDEEVNENDFGYEDCYHPFNTGVTRLNGVLTTTHKSCNKNNCPLYKQDYLQELKELGYEVKVTSTGNKDVTYTVTISKTMTGDNLETLMQYQLGELQ